MSLGDYGRPLEFGYFLVPTASADLLHEARTADDLGLDLIGVQDHPYQWRYVDTWTLLSMIAATTTRVRMFPDVASLPMRPPAVLAKSAASLDLLSDGRFELGLGAGAFWEGIAAFGGSRRTPAEALGALGEAIDVIRLMWTGNHGLRYSGEHYQLAGAKAGPVPAHSIGIWLGVAGPRALSLAGRSADGWVPSASYVPPSQLPAASARIDEAAHSVGRQPADIRRVYNVNGVITNGESGGFLNGPVQQWVDELTDLAVGYGMDTFVFWPENDQLSQLERFAAEVVPRVREEVAAERG